MRTKPTRGGASGGVGAGISPLITGVGIEAGAETRGRRARAVPVEAHDKDYTQKSNTQLLCLVRATMFLSYRLVSCSVGEDKERNNTQRRILLHRNH